MVIIRDIASRSSHWNDGIPDIDSLLDSRNFYDWLIAVIDYACTVRRDQQPDTQLFYMQPSHPGHMAQLGLTVGARHIPSSKRQVAWGVSYSKKLSDDAKIAHDEDAIGACGIIWSIILFMLPTEVTDPVIEVLHDRKIPHMATRYVAPGRGFRIEIGGRHIVFPETSRSPPEFYLIRGYAA
ncbi:hypothetical protein FB446DRAFT_640528 [Lentinula raphanica]|nr:hypothetical protein FB446DRAFT_640528 [Lentinula raphanica]